MRRKTLVAVVAALALVLSGCDWAQYLHGPDHTGSTPDTTVHHDDVAQDELVQAWTGGGSVWDASSPVVANGTVFVTTAGHGTAELEAFDAGDTGCTGTPAWCRPLWTAPTGIENGTSAAAVAGGHVYTGWMDPATGEELAAFDVAGTTGCSGSPKVCTPLWTTATGGYMYASAAPTVAGGLVFMPINRYGSHGTVAAFDAAGVRSCGGAPKRCTPLWEADLGATGAASSPTVAGGVLYVETGAGLQAFDANGVTGCTGTPARCTPLWTSAISSTTPVVAGGFVYLATGSGIAVLDAAGAQGCSGTPKVCAPLWRAATTGTSGAPVAVGSGRVFVPSTTYHPGNPGADTSDLQAFDASGSVSCGGSPKTCSPLWTARLPGGTTGSSPAVADGVVYIGTQTYLIKAGWLSAFDAAGVVGCSGTPRTCQPMTSGSTYGISGSSAAIANGYIYVVGSFNGLIAFTLDRAAPTAKITYPPAGASVSGTVPIIVDATDDRAVKLVDLSVSGPGGAAFGVSTIRTTYGWIARWD